MTRNIESSTRSSTVGETSSSRATGRASTHTPRPSTSAASQAPALESAESTPLAEAGQRTVETAGAVAKRATDTGISQVDRGREQAADTLSQVARSIRRASENLGEERQIAHDITDTVAEQTDRLAGYLRQTDARQMIRNVEDIARQQPLLFLGGAFVVGLLGARFIKVMTNGDTGSPQMRTSYRRPAGSDRMPVPMGATEV